MPCKSVYYKVKPVVSAALLPLKDDSTHKPIELIRLLRQICNFYGCVFCGLFGGSKTWITIKTMIRKK